MSENNIQSFFDLPVYQDDMQTMLEKHNIEKLIQYERYCRDNEMFNEMEKCYAEDSHVKITWFDGNGREFVRRSAKMAEGKETDPYFMPKHKIYNTFVWLNGDKAIAECQCMMFNYHDIDGAVYNREGFARLLYRVEKENGIWQVKSMDCIYERDFMVPVVPGQGKEFTEEDFSKYRKSYKCISWIFEHQGMPCSDDEAGDDKPETVKKLYEEAGKWLFDKGGNNNG